MPEGPRARWRRRGFRDEREHADRCDRTIESSPLNSPVGLTCTMTGKEKGGVLTKWGGQKEGRRQVIGEQLADERAGRTNVRLR